MKVLVVTLAVNAVRFGTLQETGLSSLCVKLGGHLFLKPRGKVPLFSRASLVSARVESITAPCPVLTTGSIV